MHNPVHASAMRASAGAWNGLSTGYALAVLALLLVNVLRSLAVELPQQLSDETTFLLTAKHFPDWQRVFSLGYTPVPGILFLKAASYVARADHYYALAKVANAVCLTVAAVPAYFVARRLMPPAPAKAASLLVAIAPSTIYGAYFTPEAVYILLFWLFAAASVAALESPARNRTALASGALCAMAYLVKPHAAALAGAYVVAVFALTLMAGANTFSGGEKRAWSRLVALRHVALFALAGAVTLFALGRILVGHWLAAFDLHLYSRLTTDTSILGAIPALPAIATLLALHAAAIVCALAIPFAMLATFGARIPRADHRLQVVTVFALAVVSLLVLMTAKATVDFHSIYAGSNTLDRLHGRYYMFALPLLVFVAIGAADDRPRRGMTPRRAAGLVAAVIVILGCVAVVDRQTFTFLDAPNLAYLLGTRAIVASTLAIVLIATACAVVPAQPSWMLIAGTAFMALLGDGAAGVLQHNEDRVQTGDRAVGVLRNLFGREDLDHGIIVKGMYPIAAARAAFRLASASPTVLTLADVHARMDGSTRWILVPGDRTGVSFGWPAIVVGDSAVYVANPNEIFSGIEFTPGRTRYSFASDAMSQPSAAPSNAPEAWGTWLSGTEARIAFPAPLPASGTLIVTAGVLDPVRQSPIDLIICGSSHTLKVTSGLAAHRVSYACADRPDRIQLAGMRPLTPRDIGLSADSRALALAIRSVEVESAAR